MQKQATKSKQTDEEEIAEIPTSVETEGAGLKTELDDLLDEIDEVLEENAATFVKHYVQKGGE